MTKRRKARQFVPSEETLRVLYAFLKEVAAAELKRFPILGGTVAALEKFSEEEDARETTARIQRLLTMAAEDKESLGRIRDDIDVLTAITTVIYLKLGDLPAWALANGQAVQPAEVTTFTYELSLLAYRTRVAIRYMY